MYWKIFTVGRSLADPESRVACIDSGVSVLDYIFRIVCNCFMHWLKAAVGFGLSIQPIIISPHHQPVMKYTQLSQSKRIPGSWFLVHMRFSIA